MSRHSNPEDTSTKYLEVPMIIYSAGRRVRVGIASVFPDGISAHFDAQPDDDFARAIVSAITRGAINALSIAPAPDRDPTLADYIKERE